MTLHRFKFEGSPGGVDPGRLDALEIRLGGELDIHFREFLAKMNGGTPDPSLVSSCPLLQYPILVFWGLNESKSNLLEAYDNIQALVSVPKLLPIARDTALQRICLKIGMTCSPVILVSVDELYGQEPTKIIQVCDSFCEFVESLSQPASLTPELEQLAERPWNEIQMFMELSNWQYLIPRGNELSLLCQTIRAENDEAFYGLLSAGADLRDALRIAVTCGRLDFVRKLIESGALSSEGIAYAVGPNRQEIREFLKTR